MSLPLILGLVIMSLVAGGVISKLGYYSPFVLASSIMMAIGAGLLTTLEVNTGHSKWIGYQALYGFGVGCGMQQTLIAVQTALPEADVPIGTAIMMFTQILGGALSVSVGQNVFTNQLSKNLLNALPNFDPDIVLTTGATEIHERIASNVLPAVLRAYSKALTQTFYVSAATGAASIFGAVLMPWLSVKGKNVSMGAAA